MNFRVRKLSTPVGAEIMDIDLRDEQTEEAKAFLRRTFLEHGVLLFRNQDITPEQHIAFTHIFGEVETNDAVPDYRDPTHKQIVLVTNEKRDGKLSPTRNIGRQWHSDHSMTTRPTLGSLLHAQQIPETGGDTMFASMYEAYESLSDALKQLIDPLWAVHDALNARHLRGRPMEELAAKRVLMPAVAQPVVRTHPETGRKALYVSEMLTSKFVGMTEDESRPLLEYLFKTSTRPEFVYRHQWRRRDLLMWDNRCMMHYALADFDESQIRTMRRTALVGELSGYLVQDAA